MARETYIFDPMVQKVVTKDEYLARDRSKPGSKSTILAKPVERGSWVYDRATRKLVNRNECKPTPRGTRAQIIRDIDPYKATAADTNGKRPVIGGRRQHREFLARNKYVEFGNEQLRNNLQYGPKPGDVARDIKRALGE